MRKICYLFVFNGFDCRAMCVRETSEYRLKTIAINKEPIRSSNGITIMPDLDFIPDIDLIDIDSDNTAMLILPGITDEIMPLVNHCLLNDIPVVQSSELVHHTPEMLTPIL